MTTRHRRFVVFLACTFAAVAPPSPFRRQSPVAAVHASAQSGQAAAIELREAIKARVAGGGDPALPLLRAEWPPLQRLYADRGHAPAWLDADGRPGADAAAATAMVGNAASDGLAPGDYAAADLDAERHQSQDGFRDRERAARFDVRLSASVLRYFRHLHVGRVDPRRVGFRLDVPADRHDVVAILEAALADHRVAAAGAALVPSFPQYRSLRDALARYRVLASRRIGPVPVPAKAVHPGDAYDGAPALRMRLESVGDLIQSDASASSRRVYDAPLAEAVRRFQDRHGLRADGILGRQTVSALQVPLAWRVRQIELALERLRWIPDVRDDERIIVLNIPMFRLWAWDPGPPGRSPVLEMKAIVGRALRTQTPVFEGQLTQVIFRPYWNVPLSIAAHEILPRLARDPGYLAREQMEIVSPTGDDARVVQPSAQALAQVRAGRFHLRQRPGPQNSLGLIKFVFPNDDDVYMHGTPARELFKEDRRDFSHGCVRAADPIALAEWVLAGSEWGRAGIEAAIDGTQTVPVAVPRPLTVLLFYTTAAVLVDGTLHFAEDIYQHDRTLDRALG